MAIASSRVAPVAAGTWTVDPEHTTVEFRVKHAGVARVRGVFRDVEGTLEVLPDGSLRARGSVIAASLDTGLGVRDEHLRSADFFDVEYYPSLTFASTAIARDGDDVRITGELKIRGVTRSIELEGELTGTGRDDDGLERVGLELSGRLDRRDFGLIWNSVIDGGGLLVGNRVDLQLEVSAVRQDGDGPA